MVTIRTGRCPLWTGAPKDLQKISPQPMTRSSCQLKSWGFLLDVAVVEVVHQGLAQIKNGESYIDRFVEFNLGA